LYEALAQRYMTPMTPAAPAPEPSTAAPSVEEERRDEERPATRSEAKD